MKVNASGEAPIMMSVTHEKERINISLDVKVNPAIWDATKQRIKGNSELVIQNNNHLNSCKAKILKTYDALFNKAESFTVKQIVEEYNWKEEKQIGNDGKRWLYITRTKTNTLTQVPLLLIAEEILIDMQIIQGALRMGNCFLCLVIR